VLTLLVNLRDGIWEGGGKISPWRKKGNVGMESAASLESFPYSAALWRVRCEENCDWVKFYEDEYRAMEKFENGMHI